MVFWCWWWRALSKISHRCPVGLRSDWLWRPWHVIHIIFHTDESIQCALVPCKSICICICCFLVTGLPARAWQMRVRGPVMPCSTLTSSGQNALTLSCRFTWSRDDNFLLCPPQGFPGRDGSEVSVVQSQLTPQAMWLLLMFTVVILRWWFFFTWMITITKSVSASGATRIAWEAGKIIILDHRLLTLTVLLPVFLTTVLSDSSPCYRSNMWTKFCTFDLLLTVMNWQGEDGEPGYPGPQGPPGAKVHISFTH